MVAECGLRPRPSYSARVAPRSTKSHNSIGVDGAPCPTESGAKSTFEDTLIRVQSTLNATCSHSVARVLPSSVCKRRADILPPAFPPPHGGCVYVVQHTDQEAHTHMSWHEMLVPVLVAGQLVDPSCCMRATPYPMRS